MARGLGRLALAAGLGCALADPEASNMWAVIAAGSAGFFNYRHQADACHAYHVLRKGGIPESNIILMMQDDVANSDENPFKGKLYNKPGDDSVDVYEGCKIDYKGSVVTADLFVKVITGDASAGGKVLKSTDKDRVFLNFVDHGGVGIIAFPNGAPLQVGTLSKALKTMESKKMFKELVFYMEACESGSMFPDLTADGKIFAVTAANADESSWGFYCSPNDVVKGKHMGSCLGDLFSIAWMEDSDLGKFGAETIKQQVELVTKRTNKSHVSTFGDQSLEAEHIGNFQVAKALRSSLDKSKDGGAYDVRDIPLHTAYWRWVHAEPQDKAREWHRLQSIVEGRAADERLFRAISHKACGELKGCEAQMASARLALKDHDCHQLLTNAVHEFCPRREEHNTGGWNGYNMKFSQMLVNICESRQSLQKEAAELAELLRGECASASAAVAAPPAQIVV
eukprot:SRR837773.1170.p2 GENE.SRR837773.1170~~SRR837773.1170.p2  ORF type:complete len:453 (-),score=215.82 SRR837773.1170:70-1428(-)